MTTISTIPVNAEVEAPWTLPHRGTIGMACLILAEAAIFIIFVVAYIFYIGKSLSGPTPAQVLELPIFGTICLLSSSITVHFAVSALQKKNLRGCTLGLAGTVLLGAIFLVTTAREWYHLIHDEGLTIQTNLFGTTYYSLVGLHAVHVIVGLILLSLALAFSLAGRVKEEHAEKLEVLSLYWHFVDAVWVVVLLVVYVLGK
ncbi:cytochrome c oxidase subunit 3 [Edaphobacter modestus]|jgi:cytochrome c oxidase subunit III|uniref:cytochrome-c oxidase n=1 Tax=Edaphobacter modestus TaxID=388466 RepID=A0A4Q7YUK1_9BACT|nr:heme-copper oxidase subunit III [Edaphobacter modestus]RZU40781.1 cytochrome c oxidase subunit 3/cytochrome o ubiquinol oxidase subunit 3 [Edaphobacter modestus]